MEQNAEVQAMKGTQHAQMKALTTPVAVLAMGLLQSYSPYRGEEDLLAGISDSTVLINIRTKLYRTGYLMWDAATKDYKLTSLGEDALRQAMTEAGKANGNK